MKIKARLSLLILLPMLSALALIYIGISKQSQAVGKAKDHAAILEISHNAQSLLPLKELIAVANEACSAITDQPSEKLPAALRHILTSNPRVDAIAVIPITPGADQSVPKPILLFNNGTTPQHPYSAIESLEKICHNVHHKPANQSSNKFTTTPLLGNTFFAYIQQTSLSSGDRVCVISLSNTQKTLIAWKRLIKDKPFGLLLSSQDSIIIHAQGYSDLLASGRNNILNTQDQKNQIYPHVSFSDQEAVPSPHLLKTIYYEVANTPWTFAITRSNASTIQTLPITVLVAMVFILLSLISGYIWIVRPMECESRTIYLCLKAIISDDSRNINKYTTVINNKLIKNKLIQMFESVQQLMRENRQHESNRDALNNDLCRLINTTPSFKDRGDLLVFNQKINTWVNNVLKNINNTSNKPIDLAYELDRITNDITSNRISINSINKKITKEIANTNAFFEQFVQLINKAKIVINIAEQTQSAIEKIRLLSLNLRLELNRHSQDHPNLTQPPKAIDANATQALSLIEDLKNKINKLKDAIHFDRNFLSNIKINLQNLSEETALIESTMAVAAEQSKVTKSLALSYTQDTQKIANEIAKIQSALARFKGIIEALDEIKDNLLTLRKKISRY